MQPSRKEWAEKMSCFLSGLPSYNLHRTVSSSFMFSYHLRSKHIFLGIGYFRTRIRNRSLSLRIDSRLRTTKWGSNTSDVGNQQQI